MKIRIRGEYKNKSTLTQVVKSVDDENRFLNTVPGRLRHHHEVKVAAASNDIAGNIFCYDISLIFDVFLMKLQNTKFQGALKE